MKTWLEYDGENDVCGFVFKDDEAPNSTYFRIADIPFKEMHKMVEKWNRDFGEIARMRVQHLEESRS